MNKKFTSIKLTQLEEVIGILFVILALTAAFIPYFNIDLKISENIQSIHTPVIVQTLWLVSMLGNAPWIEILIGAIFFLFLKYKMHTEAFISIFSSFGGAFVDTFVKILVHRPRPEIGLINVFVQLSDKSFPSGHVLVFTSYFGFLLYLSLYVFKKSWIKTVVAVLSIFLILTIGISRIYLGAHWASDVLGGYLLGSLFLITTIQIYRKAKNA